MPSGPAVSAVGPWVADSSRPTCVECYSEFGLFTRRHHCRRCGEVFCAKCSKYTSKEIPELPLHRGKSLRVCKCCFLRHLSFMVVARSAFGSVNVELFGSREDALKYYTKCKRSKMLLQMRDNNILSTSFEDVRVEQKLRQKAQGARNFLLGGHQFAGQLVADPTDSSRISFAGEPRVTPGASTVIFVSMWGNNAWYYAVRDIRGAVERQQAVDSFIAAAKRQKEVSKAVVFTLRGLTVLSAYSDGVLSRTSAVVATAQHFVRTLPCVLVLHIGGHCTSRVLGTLNEGLEALDRLPLECSALLISTRMEILAKHRCDIPSFREELCLHAGATMLSAIHSVSHVAVVSARDVVSITTNAHTAQLAAQAEFMTHGNNDVAAPIAVLALANEAKYRDLTREESTFSPEETANDLYELWVHGPAEQAARPVKSLLPPHRVTQVARALVSACRATAAAQSEARESREDGAAHAHHRNVFDSTSESYSGKLGGARGVSPQAFAPEMLMCNICMETYDQANRKPVMCPSCGNTICFECWRQTRDCPMARCDKPARPVINIALMQLLSHGDGTAASL